ncbi:hypothetical protein VFPBJ_09327 [Purpureocillium lilacinum]|uniref:Uncharacterized protein n=1 Tax=Purpureocillium lilacinum TaxID=33203 RepID=A0A179GC20_PURLI|nr:hypothetical protein VFPBJ_09327 [Purpureocillium lilacinum]
MASHGHTPVETNQRVSLLRLQKLSKRGVGNPPRRTLFLSQSWGRLTWAPSPSLGKYLQQSRPEAESYTQATKASALVILLTTYSETLCWRLIQIALQPVARFSCSDPRKQASKASGCRRPSKSATRHCQKSKVRAAVEGRHLGICGTRMLCFVCGRARISSRHRRAGLFVPGPPLDHCVIRLTRTTGPWRPPPLVRTCKRQPSNLARTTPAVMPPGRRLQTLTSVATGARR